MKKKFIPKVGVMQKKRNIGGIIYRLRLVGDRETVEKQVIWYKKKKIGTTIRNPKKGIYELWVSER